jgi:hypothetical protein
VRHAALILLPALALLAGCAGFHPGRFSTVQVTPAAKGSATWHGLPIHDGQIIVFEEDRPLSFLLTLPGVQYQPYVHAGLVVFDAGQPQVYEAWAIYKPRLHGRPTRGARGGVRRVSLASFLERRGIIAIHDPAPAVDRAAVLAFARASLASGIGFDEFFDAEDPRTMYCAEFVARALEAGGAPRFTGVPVSSNPSLRRLLDWFEVRAPRLVLAGELLRDTERRVLIDRHRGAAEIEQHFARRRELHRRFTTEQRLGNLFRWTGMALRFRPQIERYLRAPAAAAGGDAVALARLEFGVAGPDQRLVTAQPQP